MPQRVDGLFVDLVALPRAVRKAMVVALDLALCLVAVWLAYWLRLGEWELATPRVLIFAAIAIAVWALIATGTRVYRSVVRFAGTHTVISLMWSCITMSMVLGIILLTARIESVPRTLAVIHPLVFFLLIAISRVSIAHRLTSALQGHGRSPKPRRVLIYGAGWTGQQLASSIRQEPGLHVAGFIDANVALQNNVLEGKHIWSVEELELAITMQDIDEVFVAIPTLKRSARRLLVERVHRANPKIRVRFVPSLSQIAAGRVSVSDLREVQIEELLGRDEVPPDPQLMSRNIKGRRVLVTGAGGSIGSELCRQILREQPDCLIIADHSEHALYTIDMELREAAQREGLTVTVQAELVNVSDPIQSEQLLDDCRPETVFHAAAYKHVPLVELNPVAGVRNNILGTLYTCLAAEKYGATDFILVSTDKAVRPTNVMGASKRICELIIQARAATQSTTRYCSVRFGNVLGSSGSVIPLFRAQIASGGPVTITHRDATRYFMTIPEAAQLVIQAGALADDGEILLLDMGQPVKIADLAESMVKLSGLTVASESEPDGDIAIVEMGLRPGEKLIEELLISPNSEGTEHPRIIKARESMLEWGDLQPRLTELESHLSRGDLGPAMRVLRQLVPEYRPQESGAAPAGKSGTVTPIRPAVVVKAS